MPQTSLNSYEYLEKIVLNNVDLKPRIKKELALLKKAPDFIIEGFLKAYQHICIDGNSPQPLNECHSLIAYELGITTMHPGKISFHYPVNPGALPDIDTDYANPEAVKDYIIEKYGQDYVVGIPTYGKYKFKSLLSDLCRVVTDEDGERIVSFETVKEFNKKLPFKIDAEVAEDMMEDESDESDLFSNEDIQKFSRQYPQIFEHFQRLYALPKYRGRHAAGIAILPNKARETLPLCIAKGNICAEFTEGQGISELGSLGVIKIDVLGLKTLKILDTCNKLILSRYPIDENTPSLCACKKQGVECESNYKIPFTIRESTGEKIIDLNRLCLNSPSIYKAISNMATQGVFQFEPEGISSFAKRYGPKEFYDLALITSLYRPGTLDAKLDDDGMPLDPDLPEAKKALSAAEFFIERYNGRKPVIYPSPKLEKVLEKTYGIAVFQENLSQIIMEMTNCSFADAEKIRKFLTKVNPTTLKTDSSKKAELQAYEDKFVKQCLDNGCNEKEIEAVWNLIVPFARYGFNKAHAVAYSLISFQTAWCRTFFPLEYLTSLMIHNVENTDKLLEYIRTAQKLGYEILPPDINKSDVNFTIDKDNKILCGLTMLKGVGETASESIVSNRKEEGLFTSIDDFLDRKINWRLANFGVLIALTKGGAFDTINSNRALLEAKISIAKGKSKKSDYPIDNVFEDSDSDILVEDWDEKIRDKNQREIFGFLLEDYITKNKIVVEKYRDIVLSMATQRKKNSSIGTIEEIKTGMQKDKKQYARITVTNMDGIKETWLLFASVWNVYKKDVKTHEPFAVIGKKDEKNTFIVDSLFSIENLGG
jgi:DNA polymerase III subunit alpha